jgi:hypothetical protein
MTSKLKVASIYFPTISEVRGLRAAQLVGSGSGSVMAVTYAGTVKYVFLCPPLTEDFSSLLHKPLHEAFHSDYSTTVSNADDKETTVQAAVSLS